MHTVLTKTGNRSRQPRPTRPLTSPDARTRMRSTLEMTDGLYLLYEALSRARMRRPQDIPSEAYRSARQTAMRARREQNRQLGA
jgi:hypothetical protein